MENNENTLAPPSKDELKQPNRIKSYNGYKGCFLFLTMAEREYKEKVKVDDDEAKIEREGKDEFGNKFKEKHEIKED